MAKKLLQKLVGILSIIVLTLSSIAVFAPAQKVSADYPNGDCDSNAVLRCGVSGVSDLKSKYRANQGGDTKAIFSHFGMKSESALNGMVKGRVTKSGEIWVGSKKIATGAVTAGRHKMGDDEVKVPGANAWMRPPSRSFRSQSLETLIKLNERGEFVYGVIMSCGNPVQAQHKIKFPPKEKPKPQPEKPNLSIEKSVRVLGDSNWQQQVIAEPGDELQYMITVRNTGDADLKNVRVRDSLPQGVSFENDKLVIAPTPNNFDFTISQFVGDGINLGTLSKGKLLQITFVVTIGEELTGLSNFDDNDDDTNVRQSTATADEICVNLRNIAHAKADNVPEKEDDARAKVCQQQEEKPAPQVKAEQSPPVKELPVTGAAGVVGAFSITSFLGFAAYKLKEFYSLFLR